jgi:membrane protein
MRTAWNLFVKSARRFRNDRADELAAALAFYTTFSLSPLFLIAIAIAGMTFGEGAARQELLQALRQIMGPEGAATIGEMLTNSSTHHGGIVAVVIGLITLVVGATAVFASLQSALDVVWEARVPPEQTGIWKSIKDRLLHFSMVCGLGLLLLISLLFNALITTGVDAFSRWLPGSVDLVRCGDLILSLLFTFILVALIFKLLPHRRIAWSDVWAGAAITTLLFTAGKHLIGFYLGWTAIRSAFGAAGSLVVLVMWIYYSSIILLFGAECARSYAEHRGRAVH